MEHMHNFEYVLGQVYLIQMPSAKTYGAQFLILIPLSTLLTSLYNFVHGSSSKVRTDMCYLVFGISRSISLLPY
jgi:hypothetical protein